MALRRMTLRLASTPRRLTRSTRWPKINCNSSCIRDMSNSVGRTSGSNSTRTSTSLSGRKSSRKTDPKKDNFRMPCLRQNCAILRSEILSLIVAIRFTFREQQSIETVEKPFVCKVRSKPSHFRHKNRQNVVPDAKNMAHFVVFVPLCKDGSLQKDFFDSFIGSRYRRLAGRDSLTKQTKPKAPKKSQFGGANPAVRVQAL